MLRELVHLVDQQPVLQVDELAQRLHTTPALVQAMLETLERQGVLRSLAPTCGLDTSCAACPLNGMCRLQRQTPPTVWFKMEK